jgi:long-chain acyl-CoA synthetase
MCMHFDAILGTSFVTMGVMRFDVDLHRHTIKLPNRVAGRTALEMSVVETGPVSGDKYVAPTIVFIHGFGGRAAYWEYQLEQFHADYRVIALDLRGHGYTDAPTEADGAHYDVPELVADIEAALDALRVPERFILVCHSFGGALASFFVNKHPQRVASLIIIASAVRFRLRLWGRMLLRTPPKIVTWVRSILPYVGYNAAKMYPPAHVIYLQNRNALTGWDGHDYFCAITVPTLVILGQRDTLFSEESYREVAKLIPAAEQVVIQVSAHQVMVERPDAVNRAIERFIQAQNDPVALAEARAAQKAARRTQRKKLEAARPWLKYYDARTPYRIKAPTVALPRLLEATARRFGKVTALHYLGRKISWRELDKLVNRFAHGLIARRVRPDERVMLALPNTPQWVIAYFGILKAGAVAVLSDAATPQGALLDRIKSSGAAVLIICSNRHDELRPILRADSRAKGLRRVVFATLFEYMGWREKLKFAAMHHVQDGHLLPWFRQSKTDQALDRRFSRFSDVLAHGRLFAPDIVLEVDQIAVVAYTFGANAQALPVPLSHRNLASNALQLRHWLPESRPGDERFLAQQPLSSAYGLTCLLHLGVYLGATLILLPDNDLQQILKTVQRLRPTYFPTTPRMVWQLSDAPDVRSYGLASIRVCSVSGSPLPREVREKFEKITRGRLIEAFGLTEASAAVLAMPVAARRQVGVVGLPLPDTDVKIVDLDSEADLGPDLLGELWLRGPQVFAGYDTGGTLNQHATNGSVASLASLATLARLKGDGWFASGDIASMDDDGFVTIIDRKDNMLVRLGERVFPRQIEEILFEHPAIALAKVLRECNEEGVVQLRAQIMLRRNMKLTQDEVLKYCAKRLHPSALPDRITIEQ